MLRHLAVLLVCILALVPAARAERIVKVKVLEATKTDRNTVLSITGFDEGDNVTETDIPLIRERLLASGLFREVSVTLERARGGVNLVIVAKDRISWFILPTFSYSEDNYGGGIAFGETNLFGRQKKVLLYAAMSNTTGTLVGGFQDPSFLGSWLYYQIDGQYQWDQVREYFPMQVKNPLVLRTQSLELGGGGFTAGVRWWRKFKTEGRIQVRHVIYNKPKYHTEAWQSLPTLNGGWATYDDWEGSSSVEIPRSKEGGGTNVTVRGIVGWDGRATVHGVQDGMALLGNYEQGIGDYHYFKAWVTFHWALRFRQEHNLVVRGLAGTSRDVPFFEEFESGGAGFRGYLNRQFRGDSRLFGSMEYIFPIVKVFGLHMRGLVFFDSNLSWFLEKPDCRPASDGGRGCADGYPYAERISDGGRHVRYYLPGQYFSLKREAWNNGVGCGLRFALKAIAIPLVGVDYGYGLESRGHQIYLTLGMPM